MTRTKKILLAIGIIGLSIGGYAITKYLTRNTYRYKYGSFKVVKFDTPATSSNDIE